MQISKIKKFLYANPMRKTVSENLEKRKLIYPYQFGIEEVMDEEGEPIKKAKGYIYYKLSDLIEAIEKGNILKCLQNRK